MRALAATVLLAFPIGASAQLVQLEYEAVVDSVRRTVCVCDPTRDYGRDHPEFTGYTVGDRLHGFLTIDVAGAGPDLRPLEPALGIYPALANSGGYISGNGAPLVHNVFNDDVSVRDSTPDDPFESYIITDQWRSSENGIGQMGISIISRTAGLDIVTGEGIAQHIDVSAGSGLDLLGYLNKVVRGTVGSVTVALGLLFDRITVSTPGVCKA